MFKGYIACMTALMLAVTVLNLELHLWTLAIISTVSGYFHYRLYLALKGLDDDRS